MKKVLALVLAVVMVCGLAAISTSAAAVSYDVKVNGEKVTGNVLIVKNGDEITVEIKNVPEETAFNVDLAKTAGCKKDVSITLASQEGTKFTYTVSAPITTVKTDAADYTLKATPNKAIDGTALELSIVVGEDADDVMVKDVFEGIKNSNEGKDVKAEYTKGYLTFVDVVNPKAINVSTVSAPSALKEALEGKNYVFAGYKYAQELPGVATMKVSVNASMVLAGAKEVYVYQYSDGKLTLYPSTADSKAWAVKDGAVEFPVSATAQWVVTDKQLSTSTSTSTETNPGTGANDMIGAAVVMALVAAAGVVAFKK